MIQHAQWRGGLSANDCHSNDLISGNNFLTVCFFIFDLMLTYFRYIKFEIIVLVKIKLKTEIKVDLKRY